MKRSDEPKKHPIPFGVNGNRDDIEKTAPAGDNSASYGLGFPPITMILKAAGGLPPKGQDMNQILYELSSLARWFSSGALNYFDPDFSNEIGGYPVGAMLIGADNKTIFFNLVDGNNNNPNSNTGNWLNLSDGYLKTNNNLSEIKVAGPAAVAKALENLGLGEASKLGVATSAQMQSGTSTTLLPTVAAVMSLFSKRVFSTNDYIRIPDVPGGLIIQWGTTTGADASGLTTTTLPIAFKSNALCGVCAYYNGSRNPIATQVASITPTVIQIFASTVTGAPAQGAPMRFIVTGF